MYHIHNNIVTMSCRQPNLKMFIYRSTEGGGGHGVAKPAIHDKDMM